MSHIFISYSRRDIDFAQKIVTALAENNLDAWVDWKSIPKGEDWEQEIYRGIEEADAFLLLISPNSVASEMCNKEITHAVKNGKRILSIVICDTDPKSIHPEISKRNWIFCREGQDDFIKAIEETRQTIHTDYEWLKFHTELQVKALKWEQRKDASRLLRGKELREAEQKLTEISSLGDPQPTNLQREYILASQRNEIRQRRQITIGLGFGLAIVAVLAIFAWNQRNSALNSEATAHAEANAKSTAQASAEEQRNIAIARQITSQANYLVDKNYSLSALLGVEAYQRLDNADVRNAMLTILKSVPSQPIFLKGHSEMVTCAVFSIDGNRVATSSIDGQIIIWDAVSGEKIVSVLADPNGVYSLAYHPNGNYLVAGGETQITVWNPTTLEKVESPFVGHKKSEYSRGVFNVSFSHDGNTLLSIGGGEVIVWDFDSRSQKGIPISVTDLLSNHAEFGPNEDYILTDTLEINIWNSQTKELITTFDPNIGLPVLGLDVSPDGSFIATTSIPADSTNGNQTEIVFWGTDNFRRVGETITDNSSQLFELKFSHDSQILASGSEDGEIVLWDVRNRQRITPSLQGHSDTITSISFDSTDSRLVSSDRDGTVIIWSVAAQDAAFFSTLTLSSPIVEHIVFSPDSDLLVSAHSDSNLFIWDSKAQELITDISAHPADMVFSPDGKLLIASGNFGINLWDTAQFEILDTRIAQDHISGIAISENGEFLAGNVDDGAFYVWSLGNLEQLLHLTPYQVRFFDFIDNDNVLLLDANGSVVVLEIVGNGRIIGNVDFLEDVQSFSINRQRREMAFGLSNGEIVIWDIDTGQVINRLKHHIHPVDNLLFSKDGNLLVSSSRFINIPNYSPGDIYLWNTNGYQPIGELVKSQKPDTILSVALSNDAKLLASGNYDGALILWDIDPESWARRLCTLAHRNFTQAEWQQYFPNEPYRLTCPQYPAGQ